MLRGIAFVLCGGLALALVSCSDDTPSESESTDSTSGTTIPVATSPAASSTVVGGATTVPTSSAPAVDATTSTAPAAATTIAGRTVTNPSDSVRLGDKGPGVEEIQTALVAHGFKVVVDGDFGPQTDKAVKAFQKQSGIAQDGIVGPITWSKLQASPSATTTSVAGSGATTTTT